MASQVGELWQFIQSFGAEHPVLNDVLLCSCPFVINHLENQTHDFQTGKLVDRSENVGGCNYKQEMYCSHLFSFLDASETHSTFFSRNRWISESDWITSWPLHAPCNTRCLVVRLLIKPGKGTPPIRRHRYIDVLFPWVVGLRGLFTPRYRRYIDIDIY